jgi:CRISPR/Cas system-associated exonuclease Cas4 (RecB family)
MSHIKGWSHSRLVTFEKCKLWAYYAYVLKVPEPERELRPGQTEHANERGTRIHEAAELFVKNEQRMELLPELSKFKAEFERLRELFKKGKVSLEGEWTFDRDWQPVAWRDTKAWARMKLDALVRISDTEAVVIDYKSGRLFGNEIKHAEQAQLYQAGAFMRYPDIKKVITEFWYTDINELKTTKYTRAQGMRFIPMFERRGDAVINERDWKANPNIFSCKWCPYGPKGTKHCKEGVQ